MWPQPKHLISVRNRQHQQNKHMEALQAIKNRHVPKLMHLRRISNPKAIQQHNE